MAGVPSKKDCEDYRILWVESPFGTKTIAHRPSQPARNPVSDYMLGAVMQMGDVWQAILINKKDWNERLRVHSKMAEGHGFRIMEVRDPFLLRVAVRVAIGSQSGWVRYEPEVMAARRAEVQRRRKAGGR